MSPAEADWLGSVLLVKNVVSVGARAGARVADGTPGGTRTPNLRFWRPLLCQLSYWRMEKTGCFLKRQRRLAPPALVPTRLAACQDRIPACAGMMLQRSKAGSPPGAFGDDATAAVRASRARADCVT